MASSTLLVLVGLVAVAVADFDIATIKPCKGDNSTQEPADTCTVTEVRIDPCTTHKKHFCRLTKGAAAKIEFDFVPKFNATKVNVGVYYGKTGFTDVDKIDPCEHTTCPTVYGQSQRFHYDLYLGTKLPKGRYDVNWKVWDADNPAQGCCFSTILQLVNGKQK